MNYNNLKQLDNNLWELPIRGKMKVPGRIYANKKLLQQIYRDNALEQVCNVACLPGIRKYSLAMPDIHWGYGFPIGGVAAMDRESGVISPGGVGYDINCGVRFIRTKLGIEDVKGKLDQMVNAIFREVPTGVGSRNAIDKLSYKEMKKILTGGAKWAIEKGYGIESDLAAIEEGGQLSQADPEKVSSKAMQRGSNQPGTLGSGNHFIEIGIIKDVLDRKVARSFKLKKDQIIIMIHTGSRGLGHQICDDYVHKMLMEIDKLGFDLPDRQLACAKINSKLGEDYYKAMACAANYAWANRQIIMSRVEKEISTFLRVDYADLGFELIYDVCHNIAKFEQHMINGEKEELCVHRKGATRAFGPSRTELASKFRETGQPVIIPGDMGTESYLCVGTDKAMIETFGSSCHGAGRTMSRHQALRSTNIGKVFNELKTKHIYFRAAKNKTLVEEMSDAYKNVSEVVNTMHDSGIVKKVVRTKPLGVVKG